MDYVVNLLAPFLLDKRVWGSIVGWGLTAANAYFKLGLDNGLLVTLNAAVTADIVGHLAHCKYIGGN